MLASGVGRYSSRRSSAQAAGTWVCGCNLFFPSFCRLIESSLGSVATKLNFFIHNLAQMKFLGSDDRLTLSFAPRTHTLKSSGRISGVFLCRHEKVFHPNKGYVSVCSSLAVSCSPPPHLLWLCFFPSTLWVLELAEHPVLGAVADPFPSPARVACLLSGR